MRFIGRILVIVAACLLACFVGSQIMDFFGMATAQAKVATALRCLERVGHGGY
jgi:hypothetical protein